MSAWLYKSGRLLTVETPEHCGELTKLGIATISEAVQLGWVRIRRSGDLLAFQARSKDLLRSAARLFLESNEPAKTIAVEFPGRYLEFTPEELYEFL